MPVNVPNSEYTLHLPTWLMVKDAIAGFNSPAIQKRLREYVPKVESHDDSQYQNYCSRAVWFAATSRTLDAWVGMICRKSPTSEIPDSIEVLGEDVDLHRTPLITYVAEVIRQLCSLGRAGTLIDWSADGNRPYLTFYETLAIINWKYDVNPLTGKVKLQYIVLKEEYSTDESDEFTSIQATQYRVLKMTPDWTGVVVEIHRKVGDGWAIHETKELKKGVQPLPEIPFVIHSNAIGIDCFSTAPLGDIAVMNFAHLRNSADFENALHIAGLPTPWAAGFTDDNTKGPLVIGTTAAWCSSDPNAKCGFLEFQGQGLQPLENAMKTKEAQMAAMGARVLEQKSSGNEAFDTVQLRAASETNSLTEIADAASRSCSLVLAWCAYWANPGSSVKLEELTKETAYVTVSKEFTSSTASPTQISAWLQAYNSGAISFETFFFNMQRGEQYETGRTLEEEKDAIAQEAPPAPRTPPVNPNAA